MSAIPVSTRARDPHLNHHHTEVTCSEPNLPVFRRILHGEVSKALNALLAAERYDEPRQLWDDRPTHAMRLLDAEAQASHMVYSHVNAVAAGLVRSPEDMPGWTFDFGRWKSGTVWVNRPNVYFDADTHPDRLALQFTPPPLLYRDFDRDIDALVHHMRKLTEDAVRHLDRARGGRAVLGAHALRRLHPWNEPRTLRESGGERVPTFKIGARGPNGRTMSIVACVETRRFRHEHRAARLARQADEQAEFPYGTYWMRIEHRVRVAKPRHDAFVHEPGPTLDEVKQQLASTAKELVDRASMLARVRAAFELEAADMVETDELGLHDEHGDRWTAHDVGRTEDPAAAQVRHRFTPNNRDRLEASRVIVLRDRRRGRPARPTSTDPPV